MDKRALLKQRGRESIRQILAESGGVYATDEVAELLGISLDEVSTLVEERGLLAIELDGEVLFPTWQFDENGIIPGFVDIMRMLDTASPVGIVRFFLTHEEALSRTPIDSLEEGDRESLDLIRLLAINFNSQLAR